TEKPRQIAARVLQRHAGRTDYLENVLEQELAGKSLPPSDRGLAQELAFGVVRWQATLDWLITRKTAGRPQKTPLQILLRLGLYQMFWLDRIPDHAAVHETVEMAKHLGYGPQAGFINAVLRGYLRERDQTEQALADLKLTQPALGYSHPDWLCARWQLRWGEEKVRRLLQWNNTPPRTFARVNALRATADQLRSQWEKEGVAARLFSCDWAGESLIYELESHPSLAALPSFRSGFFYVQDPSTLLAVRELNPQPGETILDLCAAPGGKTTLIAQLMQNRGRIVAQDDSPDRLKWVEENSVRLGVSCVETSGPSTFGPRPSTLFDRILVDAPCSNTGVMSRRVDLRWRIRPEEIDRLRAAQLALLRRAVEQLRPGGTLVYSTCSLEPEENGEVVTSFLAERAEFKLEHERELQPFTDGVDGAYVARLTSRP
ncbi:MAG TPA: 16S rRNA (cytosine(967)-C(5))-methyltransferase RsmB, partial [Verrucomicrobiae bacterium]